MLNVLILEDENYTRKFIQKLVLEIPLISKAFDASNSNDAIKLANENKLDIVLIDIELECTDSLNGLETAKIINNINPKVEFIFITGYSKYALESFNIHPYDYILKPINVSKLKESIYVLSYKIKEDKFYSKKSDMITIKNKNEILFIPTKNILFLEKQSKDILIHTSKNIYTYTQSLSHFEKKLDNRFLRVHKSFIVNKSKIQKIKDVGNRSYIIEFGIANKVAFMSRYKFEELKEKIVHLP